MTIRAKFIWSFSIISVTIISLVIFVLSGLSKSTTGFTDYRAMAKDTVLASEVQANMLMVRMNVKDYLKTTAQRDIDDFNVYYNKTRKFINEALKEIKKPSRAPLIKNISDDFDIYKDGFVKVTGYMKERNKIVNDNLDVNGKK